MAARRPDRTRIPLGNARPGARTPSGAPVQASAPPGFRVNGYRPYPGNGAGSVGRGYQPWAGSFFSPFRYRPTAGDNLQVVAPGRAPTPPLSAASKRARLARKQG